VLWVHAWVAVGDAQVIQPCWARGAVPAAAGHSWLHMSTCLAMAAPCLPAGAYTPRFSQPLAARHTALKQQQGGGGAAISLHVSAGGATASLPPTQRPSQLLPRMPPSATRSMTAVAGMQEARRAQAAQQSAQWAEHRVAQQAAEQAARQVAEQAAVREYMKSKPPQVAWEEEGSVSRVARVAEQLSRSQARLAHSAAAAGRHGSGSSSFTSTGSHSCTTATASIITNRAASEAGLSEASTEIVPVPDYTHPHPPNGNHSGRSARLPEQLRRAAARVQSGSPRSSAARARGAFATKVCRS
jgi:hypothetical protein